MDKTRSPHAAFRWVPPGGRKITAHWRRNVEEKMEVARPGAVKTEMVGKDLFASNAPVGVKSVTLCNCRSMAAHKQSYIKITNIFKLCVYAH